MNYFTDDELNGKMYTSPLLNLAATSIYYAKKAKADRMVVICKSVVSGHIRMKARPRLSEKLEFIDIDPVVRQEVLYKEEKKVRSIRDHQIALIPRLIYTNQIDSKWDSIAKDS